jgi:hypothetical protein
LQASDAPGIAPPAHIIVAAAAWHRRRLDNVDARTLELATAIARRNQVLERLATVYPEFLSTQLRELRAHSHLLNTNIQEVARLLSAAGIRAVLIKASKPPGSEYSNFDVVVGRRGWVAAREALREWTRGSTRYWLETDKLLLHPSSGPAAHLHKDVSWFGVVIIKGDALLERAEASNGELLWPAAADALRIYLAHAAFQNLSFDLAELIELKGLVTPENEAVAFQAAKHEGWEATFASTLLTAKTAIARLNRSRPLRLPIPLPLHVAALAGAEHGCRTLLREKSLSGAREMALRAPLIVTKRRALKRAGATRKVWVIGVSGADGAGKSTVTHIAAAYAESRGCAVRVIHPYGCLLCRNAAGGSSTAAHARSSRTSLVHAWIDAGELGVRLLTGRALVRLARHFRHNAEGLLLTDRSPLDTLVKFNLPLTRLPSRWLVHTANGYDRIMYLHGPAELLASRDGEHAADLISDLQERFARRSLVIATVSQSDINGCEPSDVADALIRSLLDSPLAAKIPGAVTE